MKTNPVIQQWLTRQSGWLFSLFAITAAFSTYACMYAYRRAFTAASFDGYELWGMEFKTVLIISQVLGYTISKFLGIKIISEMPPANRALYIIVFIILAHLALLGFWLVPAPYNFGFLFLNGLPLGMVWGLVFSFLEGRRNTELLGAGLSISFIVSSGFVKSVGVWLMQNFQISEFAMPFMTGLIFTVPLFFFVWMLQQVPPPTKDDELHRVKRIPMSAAQRLQFFRQFAGGIIVLTLCYMSLTAYRDLRDNYAFEILSAIGYQDDFAIFTKTEAPIALIVLIVMASLMYIRDNKRALLINHIIIGFGLILIGVSTWGFQQGWIDPYWWMVLVGLGSYLGYVPFNCILFDRFIANFHTMANAGFLIYIADSFGYLSSIGVLLYKNFGNADISWFDFFTGFSYLTSILGVLLTIISMIYFLRKTNTPQPSSTIQ